MRFNRVSTWMKKKTANIGFIAMGLLIMLVSVSNLTLIPLFVGLMVLIQGLYGLFKK